MKEIYLAGGCYWGVEKYISNLRGVTATEVGFANGHTVAPAYVEVKHGDTGHAETVHVTYDEAEIPLPSLLRLFLRIIDPTSVNQQGEDIGTQYRTGIYWTDPADETNVKEVLADLEIVPRELILYEQQRVRVAQFHDIVREGVQAADRVKMGQPVRVDQYPLLFGRPEARPLAAVIEDAFLYELYLLLRKGMLP